MLTGEELEVMREEQEQNFNAEGILFRYLEENRATNPITLKEELGDPDVVYDGPLFYQATTRSYENIFTQAEARQIARTYIFRLPWNVIDVRVGDLIEVTVSEDPYGALSTFTVIDPQTSSQIIDRKIIAELHLGH